MNKGKVKIVQKGDPVLRKKAEVIPIEKIKSPETKAIIKQMSKALRESELGIAIAANQIGIPKRIFLVSENVLHPERLDVEETQSEKPLHNTKIWKPLVFINPKITKTSRKKELKTEGCLSVEGVYGKVMRAEKITVEAYDKNGKKFQRGASGLLAQAIQHETDHLDGILFIDKAEEILKNGK